MSELNPTLHLPYHLSSTPVVKYTNSIASGVITVDDNNTITGNKINYSNNYLQFSTDQSSVKHSIVCIDNDSNFTELELPTNITKVIKSGSSDISIKSGNTDYSTNTIGMTDYTVTVSSLNSSTSSVAIVINDTSFSKNDGFEFGDTEDPPSNKLGIYTVSIYNVTTSTYSIKINGLSQTGCKINEEVQISDITYELYDITYNNTTNTYNFSITCSIQSSTQSETIKITNYINNETIAINNTLISCDFKNNTSNIPSNVTIKLYKTGIANETTTYSLQYTPNTRSYSWMNMDNVSVSNYTTTSFNSYELDKESTDNTSTNQVYIGSNFLYIDNGNELVQAVFIENSDLDYNPTNKYIVMLDIDVIYNSISNVSNTVKEDNYYFLICNSYTQGKFNQYYNTTTIKEDTISNPKMLEKYMINVTTTTSKVFHVSKIITDFEFDSKPCYIYISLLKVNKNIYDKISTYTSSNNTIVDFFKSTNVTGGEHSNWSGYSFYNGNAKIQDITLIGSVTIMEYVDNN